MNKKTLIAAILVILYAATWVGGVYSHSQQLNKQAQRLYSEAKETQNYQQLHWKEEGLSKPPRPIVRDGGPKSYISWSIPIFPGVLFADSSYVIGPLYGKGGFKVIIYYGVGSFSIGPIWGWIA